MRFSFAVAATFVSIAFASDEIGLFFCDYTSELIGSTAAPLSDCNAIWQQLEDDADEIDGAFYYNNGYCHFRSNNNPHETTTRAQRVDLFGRLLHACVYYDTFQDTDAVSGSTKVSEHLRVCLSAVNSCNY